MRKQCLMFKLLLARSTAVTQELYLDKKTMFHVYVNNNNNNNNKAFI